MCARERKEKKEKGVVKTIKRVIEKEKDSVGAHREGECQRKGESERERDIKLKGVS